MDTLEKLPIEEMEDIKSFLQERKTITTAFEVEFAALEKKRSEATEKYDSKILFRIPLTETIIFLEKQTLENLFNYIQKDYPESGLVLREIQISTIDDIDIRFIFDVESFNENKFSYFSFNRLGFDDERNQLIHASYGVGLDPIFADREKYIAVRETLKDIRQKMKVYEPKEEKKKE